MRPFSHDLLYNFLNWFLELGKHWQLTISLALLTVGAVIIMSGSLAGIAPVLLGFGCFLAWTIR